MRTGWKHEPQATGGCQCGALRHAAPAGPARSTVWPCRMRQRATGNALAPLLDVLSDTTGWSGTPAEWASSDIALRGFCNICGTPVYYRSTDTSEIMAGTPSPAVRFRPDAPCAIERRQPRLGLLPTLPFHPTPAGPAVTSHQSPE